MQFQETRTDPAVVLLFLELQTFLTSLEAHLWQGWFQLQPINDHQFVRQSTKKNPALAYLLDRNNNYKLNNIQKLFMEKLYNAASMMTIWLCQSLIWEISNETFHTSK